MRKLTAVLFLSIFILQAFGYFFTYRLIKWHIHKEITVQISNHSYRSSAIASITLDEAQRATLLWENEEEFCYQEEWYDVVSIKQNGKLTTYYCIQDRQETKLVAGFTSFSKQQDQNPTKNNFRYTLKKLSDNFISILPHYTEHSITERSIFSTTPPSSIIQVSSSIQDPPPEA